jgi:hypothetical protein
MIARALSSLVRRVSPSIPGSENLDRVLGAAHFLRYNGRLPSAVTAEHADINDYIFGQATRNWSVLHRACVDKEFGKIVAAGLCPAVRVPRTVAVLRQAGSVEDIIAFLQDFAGQGLVAKPTHTSGGIVFLDRGDLAGQVRSRLWPVFQRDYHRVWRERQYLGLERKLLVEEKIAAGGRGGQDIPDYKFFCAAGRVLLAQVDQDRFANHCRSIVTVPDFTPLATDLLYPRPAVPPDKPARWPAMLDMAAALSRPFAFVRVDLYDAADGVTFGEFTFTPGAGFERFSDPHWGRWLLRQVLREAPGD